MKIHFVSIFLLLFFSTVGIIVNCFGYGVKARLNKNEKKKILLNFIGLFALLLLWISFLNISAYGERSNVKEVGKEVIDVREVTKTNVFYGEGTREKRLCEEDMTVHKGTDNIVEIIDLTYEVNWLGGLICIQNSTVEYNVYLTEDLYNKFTETTLYKVD